MELNGSSDVHYIQAIMGGLVSKIINVNSLGRPALKFKPLKSIYESEDSNNKQRKAAISGSPFRSDRFRTETVSDCEEIIPADISLGEIKRRCKAKRKKLTEMENNDKNTCFFPTDTSIEISYTDEQRKEDEADLEEPISSLKLKLSKKKLKQSCFQKCVFTSPVSQETFPENIPHSPQESLETVESIHTHSDVKVESFKSLNDLVSLADGSTSMSDLDTGSSGFLSYEVPRWLNGDSEEQTSSAKASATSLCIVHEPIDIKSEPLGTDANVVSVAGSYLYMSYSDMDFGEDKYHIPSTVNGNELRSGRFTFVTEEAPSCVINEVPFECLETGASTILIKESSNAVHEEPFGPVGLVMPLCFSRGDVRIVKETTDVELPQLSSQDYLSSPVLESENKGLSIIDAEIVVGIKDVELLQIRSQDSPSFPVFESENGGPCMIDADIVAGITDVVLPQISSQDYPSSTVLLEFKNEGLSISDADIIKGFTDVELQQFSSLDSSSKKGLSRSDAEIVKGVTDVELHPQNSQDSPSPPELDSNNEILSLSDAEIVGIIDVELQLLSSYGNPSYPELQSKNEGDVARPIPARAELGAIEDSFCIPENKFEHDSIFGYPILPCNKTEVVSERIHSGAEICRSGQEESCTKGITCLVDIETVTQMSESEQIAAGCDGSNSEMIGESDSKEDQPLITDDNVVNAGISFMSSQNSTPCSSLGTDSDSVGHHHSPTVQPVEKCSSPVTAEPVTDVDEVLDCSTVTSPDAINRVAVMEDLEDNHGRKLDYPPKRLFSARKAISPSSQEKLLQAVDADELYDKIKPSRIRIIGPKVKMNSDGVLKKRKMMKNGSAQLVPKGILKAPNVSFMVPRHCSEGASIQTCADKAVSFTQRQMHDIEVLATKLMKQLKSMKEIVEQSLLVETLQTDSCSSTQLKYTVDKMRMATENAAEAEETTKKWLSMMSKDCNRFCKILKTTELKAAAAAASSSPSGNEVHRKRRKITFADETGGNLCHVKIFKDDHEYLLGPESETAI
ncbi:hypothetical protein C5167_010732 [Papaver somniferum]|uniref:Uncharacterized protein n=1 Tax=Papaver somniferum TaxID=3469 RepID=A0A4Y7K4Z8_PAPSO|nr:uncharacterized protein LOC113289259 isoform X2 [Papaver somniferum]RZC67038.1 hypothetical protein C5167_010732 [Papaver somniferum]